MLQTAAFVVLALQVMILVHELAHVATARLLGVRVEEICLGQGPALFRRELAGTVFSLRPLPLGGFTRMAGMYEAEEPGAYASRFRLGRAAILLSGPAANLLAAFLVLLTADPGTALRALADMTAALGGFASGLLAGGGFFGAVPELLENAAADGHARILALIGLYLGLFNLLPVPPLDGGRLLLLIVEALRGRETSPRTIGAISGIGVAAVTILAVFLAIEDLVLLLARLFP